MSRAKYIIDATKSAIINARDLANFEWYGVSAQDSGEFKGLMANLDFIRRTAQELVHAEEEAQRGKDA